ncbi:BCCT family transporter [Fuchsiella alkaliacetigena]|uniref:BCCT family transporter n=1 Tax=Fuchsiella alkaliacetigena TaxID=957042 RepID=UPI00200A63EB|nr:BCCT family transporter [Fuchsiella alkaliacetigena]MCK8825961.1 BCCT family transporter [Fuchsiella alkaliacetigena]
MKKYFGDYDKPLLIATIVSVIAICAFAVLRTAAFDAFWNGLQSFLTGSFGWLYILVAAACVAFCLFIGFSKYGDIKLGKEDEEAEYSMFAWASMLISAGVGVGFYFWGLAEPLTHWMETPYLAEAGSKEAVTTGVSISFLHWGIHGWAIYVITGLGIALAAYKLDKSLSFSAGLYGILGDKIKGPIGKVLNFLCAFATIAGLAASLGMGVLSLSFIVVRLFSLPDTVLLKVAIMGVVMIIYLITTALGLKKGMAKLSSLNVYMAIGVLVFIYLFGDTIFLTDLFVNSIGDYVGNIVHMSFWTDPLGQQGDWLGWWTLFYWAWWFSWAPYIGGFLARISKGRTVREFVLGGMFLPTILCFVWFTVMGGTGIQLEMSGAMPLWDSVQNEVASGFYLMLDDFPLTFLISCVALINLTTFLTTSADAGSTYLGVLLSRGSSTPRKGLKIIGGVLLAALPIALIYGGGLEALQTVALVGAFPFAIIIAVIMVSVMIMLKKIVPASPKIKQVNVTKEASEGSELST